MQHYDQTCHWCASHFWKWLRLRLKAQDALAGRSGEGSFNDAALLRFERLIIRIATRLPRLLPRLVLQSKRRHRLDLRHAHAPQ